MYPIFPEVKRPNFPALIPIKLRLEVDSENPKHGHIAHYKKYSLVGALQLQRDDTFSEKNILGTKLMTDLNKAAR